jgi:hypothetical protein
MSLTRSLITQQHRPILDQLLVRLSLRQGQPDSIEGSKVRKGTDSLNATSRSRVLGNIIKQIRVFLPEAPAWCRWVNDMEGFGND